jgi:hypothetical protein
MYERTITNSSTRLWQVLSNFQPITENCAINMACHNLTFNNLRQEIKLLQTVTEFARST